MSVNGADWTLRESDANPIEICLFAICDLLDMQMDAFSSPRDQVAREWLNICHSWC